MGDIVLVFEGQVVKSEIIDMLVFIILMALVLFAAFVDTRYNTMAKAFRQCAEANQYYMVESLK